MAGYLILDLTCFGKLASAAMSMEVSSVFLSVQLGAVGFREFGRASLKAGGEFLVVPREASHDAPD